MSALLALALVLPAFADLGGGELLVCDLGNNRVVRMTPAGETIGELVYPPDPQGFSPVAAIVGPDGRAYAASWSTNQVMVFAPSGAFLELWTDNELDQPRGLAFDARGRLLVACSDSDRILVFGPDGTVVDTITTVAGQTPMNKPGTVVVSPSGDVFTTDPENNILFQFNSSGDFIRTGRIGCGNGFQLSGLAFGWNGHLFACCGGDGVVQEIDENLQIVRTIGAVGDLIVPTGIAFGADDIMYVASSQNDQIVRFGRNGAKIDSLAYEASIDITQNVSFVPFRFGVNLKGKLVVDGEMRVKLSSKFSKKKLTGPVLSVDPGSGFASLSLGDGADDEGVLFDLLGKTCVFSGLSAATPGFPKSRTITSFSMPWLAPKEPALALNLLVKGKIGEAGDFRAKSVTGALQVLADGAAGAVTMTSVKALN